jgi:hypothetical protein
MPQVMPVSPAVSAEETTEGSIHLLFFFTRTVFRRRTRLGAGGFLSQLS